MRWTAGVLLLIALCGSLPAWPPQSQTSMNELPKVWTHPWHNIEHHTPEGGFQNLWEPRRGVSVWKGMKWFLGHTFTNKTNRLPPVRTVASEALRRPPTRLRITWIGHSTMLVRTPERTVLVDPIFSRRASPYSFAGPRREPDLPVRLEDLPEIDIVLISHDHYDHLDGGTVRHLASRHDPLFLVPLGVGQYVREWGASNVLEMDWWQYVEIGGVRYHSVPAKHFSGRGMFDRDQTLWMGWFLEGIEGGDLFYAGDTGYSLHFGEIRERIGRPEIALLPIGAYLPPWMMQPVHVNPEEALRAFEDLEADHFLPVHWGTFDMAEEPLHAPADTLRRLIEEHGLDDQVHILEIGESWQRPD